MIANDSKETSGINNREHLAAAEQEMRTRLCRQWMQAGVTMLDPSRTSIDTAVVIGRDSVLYPDVQLEGETVVGESTTIRSHTRITDSTVGNRVTIQDSCVLDNAFVEDEVSVGPFAHLRPKTKVGARAKVGNFVELKNTNLGEGSKVNHLSYLGDTTIGQRVNIGAGTITCNYDGFRKEKTVIEDDVFVGSDTQLIAPVTIGRGAIIAAGTTVTSDVPPEALGISRKAQTNREGAASRKRASQDLFKGESSKDQARGESKDKGVSSTRSSS